MGADILGSSKIGLLIPRALAGMAPAQLGEPALEVSMLSVSVRFFAVPSAENHWLYQLPYFMPEWGNGEKHEGACDRSVYHTCADTDANHLLTSLTVDAS